VVSAASIPADRASGYARYLGSKTVEHEYGWYYLTPDGEMTEPAGRWLSEAEILERLGITTGSVVDGEDFLALMEGRHPGTGEWVRREGAGGGRGGEIDVTFSVPNVRHTLEQDGSLTLTLPPEHLAADTLQPVLAAA
jgi:TrwC relaxase